MDHSHLNAVAREQQLDEIVTAYLEALELGLAPDRSGWLSRYPELAAELHEFFAEQDRLERLACPLRQALRAAVPPDGRPAGEGEGPPLGLLGDFRIVREVGRGGMG